MHIHAFQTNKSQADSYIFLITEPNKGILGTLVYKYVYEFMRHMDLSAKKEKCSFFIRTEYSFQR